MGSTDHDSHDHAREHGGHTYEHPHGLKGLALSVFKPHSHDTADSIDSALESSAEGIRALKISLVVLLATAIAQLVVVVLTGSIALLADTIHNFSDALTAIPLWIAFVLVRRPPTKRYTYGLGRVEDVAGLFIVVMIALSAIIAAYESISRLVNPRDITHVWVVFAAGVIGFAGNELVAVYRIRVGRKIGSAALIADGLHARTDGFTSLAVAAGALGVVAGFPLADPIVGLIITAAILVVLKGAATEVFRRLLDGVEPALVDHADGVVRATPGVVDVASLQLRWIGHRLHAEISVEVDGKLDLRAAHGIAHEAEANLRRDVPKLSEATVHVSPPSGVAVGHSAF
jgi:cation diffusion facilitator family transporter